jgi:phospholipase A1
MLCLFGVSYAGKSSKPATPTIKGPVEARVKKEEKILPDSFAIAFYKPTYAIPYYYTGSPYNSVYQGNTPNNEKLNRGEVKYQLSLKVPVWQKMFGSCSSLYFAYTQLSYWQAYNNRAFFRENDYEPEFFVASQINYPLSTAWKVNFLNVGATHQSNGYGNSLQRGWNRLYLEAILSNDNWMISIKPWYIISYNSKNEDIGSYLGNGRVLVAYKYYRQTFALQASNFIENSKRTSAELTWSFPLIPYVKGYVQVFSGYGQSLIEYNHRTNSGGIGVAFSDWV